MQKPPLIVEGEDDERIWQAAMRHSHGRISVYPCVAGDVQSMIRFERAAAELMASVYESAKAFSLRDKDDEPHDIDNIGPVVRCRLNCRSAENLLLTDDALSELDVNWSTLEIALNKWIADNPSHSRYRVVLAFRDSGWDRRYFNLKELRMLIVGITGSSKSWEVAVGRSIARLHEGRFNGPHCLNEYLGPKIVDTMGLCRLGA